MVKTVFHDTSYTEVEYDGQGRKEIVYSQCLPGNESQRVKTKYLYDATGKLTGVINDFEGPDQIETAYDHDEAGNKTAQTVPNRNTTRWAYDDLGRVSKKTLPEMMSEHFTYFPNGNVETKTDFNGDTTTYNYHQCCGRLESKAYPDGTSVSYTYTNTGRVDEVTDARGLTDHDYDFRGRLTSVSNPDGTSLSYTYLPNGNRETVTTQPSGKTVTYRYDGLNRLELVIDPDSRQTVYTYDDAGNRKTVTYPNGVMTEYTYDDLNRLEYMENRLTSGEIISSYDYVLRDDGNRTDVYEHSGREVHYTYDRLNCLTEEYIIDPTNGEERINYTYDAFGNRATKTDSTGTTVYKYDANDRLLFEIGPDRTISYRYDANGNTIEKSDGVETTTYTYDFENRLVSAQTPNGLLEYGYDHDGIRVNSSIDGNVTRYLVDKNRRYAQVLEERDSAGSLVVSYVYGDDLISQDRGGTVSFYEYDGQLSTRQLTDISGSVTDSYVYDAFGVLTARTGTTENNYLYTGEQYEPNARFYYLRARFFDQEIGRFLTFDTWEGETINPATFNKYLYVLSNPIIYVDPSGFGPIFLSEFLVDGVPYQQYKKSKDAERAVKRFKSVKRRLCRIGKKTAENAYRIKPCDDHHADPRFIQGVHAGITFPLPRAFHQQFHLLLHYMLRFAGFPGGMGRGSSVQDWQRILSDARDVRTRQAAHQVLLMAGRIFDRKCRQHYINPAASLEDTIRRQIEDEKWY